MPSPNTLIKANYWAIGCMAVLIAYEPSRYRMGILCLLFLAQIVLLYKRDNHRANQTPAIEVPSDDK